ncbi:MAG: hypothetical protein ACSW8A_09180, partial [Lachnospiraceae bacterium]
MPDGNIGCEMTPAAGAQNVKPCERDLNIHPDKVNMEAGSGPETEKEKEQEQRRGQEDSPEGRLGKAMIAMSGGVDSSVAALLMKKAGYECLGVRMELYSPDSAFKAEDRSGGNHDSCGTTGDVSDGTGGDVSDGTASGMVYTGDNADASRVADRIGMPFTCLDYREFFKDQVIRRFVESYECGATPNPCIVCNRLVKF